MLSIMGLYAQFGMLIYTSLGTYLINNFKNPGWAMAGLGVIDFAYFIVLIISILCKKFANREIEREDGATNRIPEVQMDNSKADFSPFNGSKPLLDADNPDIAVVAEGDFEEGDFAPLRANMGRSVKFNDATEIKDGENV